VSNIIVRCLALLAACSPVSWADVSVYPSAFDRNHDAWYVEVTEQRASGLVLLHSGYVCDGKPAELTTNRICSEETVFTGEVWRMPDRTHCNEPPPALMSVMVQFLGGVRIAVLRPQTIFRGTSLRECEDPDPTTVTLWPPTKPAAGWRDDTYWTAPEDEQYELVAE
jgi:hypothetical protein